MDGLAALTDAELEARCSHACAHVAGDVRSVWHLLANDINHETMHAGQILSLRHDMGLPQTQTARLLGEWLTKRAVLAGALIGLPDEALDRPQKEGEWTIREVVEHTLYWERDSIQAALRKLATSEHWRPDPALQYGGPVPRAKAEAPNR